VPNATFVLFVKQNLKFLFYQGRFLFIESVFGVEEEVWLAGRLEDGREVD